jgi:hypothetical protein
VKPLSTFQGNAVPSQSSSSSATAANASSTKQVPIGPQTALIPTTGIKIYDEIGQAMIGNPFNPPDRGLGKLASIGIGPGKVPSTEANDTIKSGTADRYNRRSKDDRCKSSKCWNKCQWVACKYSNRSLWN